MTLRYAAPETLARGAATEAADVYSYALVVVEALVGVQPFAHLDHIRERLGDTDAAPWELPGACVAGDHRCVRLYASVYMCAIRAYLREIGNVHVICDVCTRVCVVWVRVCMGVYG